MIKILPTDSVFCYKCVKSYPRETDNVNPFVYCGPKFDYWCGATKKFVLCVRRNKNGECKYYSPQESGNIYG